jgi:molybdopterin converting factor small subunit
VLRYWAAAKDAAGVAEEAYDGCVTLAELLAAALAARDRPRLERVLARSSFLVDGTPVGRRPPADVAVGPDAVVEVLPPFAGG